MSTPSKEAIEAVGELMRETNIFPNQVEVAKQIVQSAIDKATGVNAERVAEKIVEWQNTNPTLIFSVNGVKSIILAESRAAQPQEWILEHRDYERSDIFTNSGELICAGVKTSRAKLIVATHNATLK
jgi:hypothetical protein